LLLRYEERLKKHSKKDIMRRNAGGYWEDKKEKLLKRYKNLTERDLRFNLGSEDEMIEILSFKLGKTRQELLTIIVTL
jgi:hypothetical protein